MSTVVDASPAPPADKRTVERLLAQDIPREWRRYFEQNFRVLNPSAPAEWLAAAMYEQSQAALMMGRYPEPNVRGSILIRLERTRYCNDMADLILRSLSNRVLHSL